MKKQLIAISAAIFGLCSTTQAQITIDNTLTPEEIVNDILLGGGVVASNITFTGGLNQIGTFEDSTPGADPGLGLDYGVAMNTSAVSALAVGGAGGAGGGVSGDADLLSVANLVPGLIGETFTVNSINDLAILEFDFIPSSNSLEFNYVFASDEWNTFINSQYNDAFGFFISGPGLSGNYSTPAGFPDGAINVAFVPDTPGDIPITISSITPSLNNEYYVSSSGATGGTTTDHSLNSQTTVMTAEVNVQCGQTYHIKMAIGDGSDTALDSAVFLEGGSFSSSGINLVYETENENENSRMTEGCYNGLLQLNLNTPNPDEATIVELYVGGTAINGVDYSEIPSQLIYPPGTTTQSLVIEAFEDDLVEGDEVLELGFVVCDELISFQYIIEDRKEIVLDISEDQYVCESETDPVTFIAFANGGYEDYSFTWTYEDAVVGNDFTLTVFPQETGTYTCEVVGDCGESAEATVDLNIIPDSPHAFFESRFNANANIVEEGCEYVELTFELPSIVDVDTELTFEISGNAVPGVDYYEIPNTIVIPAGEQSASLNIEAIVDGVYETDEYINFVFPFYDECKPDNTLQLTLRSVSRLAVELPENFTICEGDEIDVLAEVHGGIEPYVLTWTAPDGEVWSGFNLVDIPLDNTLYNLTVTDACGVEVKDNIEVTVPHYDPLVITEPLSSSYQLCLNDEFVIEADVKGGTGVYDFVWYIEGVEYAHGRRLVVPTEGRSNFNYELLVRDDCNTVASKQMNVEVSDCAMPNVFTPNGDGKNDYFFLNTGDAENNVRIEIFNRWGQKVFASENYELCTGANDTDCWDGTNYNTGKACGEGTYFYVIEHFDGRIKKGEFVMFK